MCGIVGIWSSTSGNSLEAEIGAMSACIAHRGPDDAGGWVDRSAGLALGHVRLAIVDLSPAGHQPMTSPSGRYVMVYNGEVYNYRDLRSELDRGLPSPWRGHSDTEVMLAAFDRWGVATTLPRLNGMFAFAVWDREDRVLTLARDRIGEKPLYYGAIGNTFVFGSELKAVAAHSDFNPVVDRQALVAFLRYNYIPAPHSIWEGIRKLPPAHYVDVRDDGLTIDSPIAYWNLSDIAAAGEADPLSDVPERVDELEALLTDAVGRQMQADVPLGAFLSGGVDSSLIVSLMQAQSAEPIRTFTIGFSNGDSNEALHAKAVAQHLGTRHTEHYVGPADLLATIPRLPAIWDEPFSDASQIPTFLVSGIARRDVTVSLSGDGGDELFGGYHRHFAGKQLWDATSWFPPLVKRGLGTALRHPAAGRAATGLMQMMPARRRMTGLADRLPKIARLLEANTSAEVYRQLVSHQANPQSYVIGASDAADNLSRDASFDDMRHDMMYLDSITYLPDDILVKVDRASMAVSLESRVPFLDHRVIEYAWRLPPSAKFRDGRGKHILREILYRHVPRSLADRPKTGFTPPINAWLRGPLRQWAEDLLDERRLRDEGFFVVSQVRALWLDLLAGHRRHDQVWAILMFQAWWAEMRSQPVRTSRHIGKSFQYA